MNQVDAVILWNDNTKAYFFKETQYVRYDMIADKADPGYPQPIAGNWLGLPSTFDSGIDAVLMRPDKTKVYFFKGSQYVRYDIAADKADPGYPAPIAGNWPGLTFTSGIDASILWVDDRKAYFFKGSQYVRYDMKDDKADLGYPQPIAGNWPGLPSTFDSGIDAVLMRPDKKKVFFFKGSQYVRYDIADDKADPGYPAPIAGNWPELATQKTFPINVPEATDTVGNTTASVSAKISKRATDGLVEVHVKVKKTGINGKGFAYGQVVLLDKDNNTLFKTDIVQKHEGADVVSGVVRGDTSQDFPVSLDILNKTVSAGVIAKAEDNNGLPSDVAEFTSKLNELVGALKAVGEVITAGIVIVVIFG